MRRLNSMKQRNLMSVRNDARAALTRRHHSRVNWQPVHNTENGGKGQNGQCSRCHGTVTVLTKPEPNQTDIAGTAIGQDCNILLSTPHPNQGASTMALIQIHFRVCNDGRVRAWRDHWYGDQFEVFTAEEWESFRKGGERMTFQFIEHDDND